MLEDIEDFGRQRPWAVLAGGLAVGVVAARFLKASSRDRYRQRSGASGSAQVAPQSPQPVRRAAVEPVVSPPPQQAAQPAPAVPTPA